MGPKIGDLRKRGWTLLEIMLALGLLSMMMVSLFIVLIGGYRMMSRAEKNDQAVALARLMVDRIRERSAPPVEGLFDGRIPSEEEFGFPPAPYPATNVDGTYWFVVSVTSVDERLWNLRVTVHDGHAHSSTLETLITK